MNQKVIELYKEDFSDEAWSIICNEFDANTDAMFITCIIDTNSTSQGI